VARTPEERKEAKRVYYTVNKERIAAKKAADAKTEHGRALDRARGQRYRAAHPERIRALQQVVRDKRAPIEKENAKQKRVELRDSYVAQILQLPTAIVPPELLEVERTRLKIKREMQAKNKTRTEKKCSACKEYRPLISFPSCPKSIDGRTYECLFCKRERKSRSSQIKGLTYTPRQHDEFGRAKKMTPEQLKANKNAYERRKYAINKQTREAK